MNIKAVLTLVTTLIVATAATAAPVKEGYTGWAKLKKDSIICEAQPGYWGVVDSFARQLSEEKPSREEFVEKMKALLQVITSCSLANGGERVKVTGAYGPFSDFVSEGAKWRTSAGFLVMD